MQHEKVYKRDDGSRVKIIVTVHLNSYEEPQYGATVMYCKPGKRTFVDVVDKNDYEYRRQEFPTGRARWERNKHIQYVTFDELYRAKLDLWEKLKPKP